MREKLIELIEAAHNAIPREYIDDEAKTIRDCFAAEADHLLANGVIVLPCKVGDTVYRICHEYKKGNPFIRAVTFNRNNFWRIVFGGEWGKTVFLTRELAEEALNEQKKL